MIRSRRQEIRTATRADLECLARIWHDGWQDAHAEILPAELARHRTIESFRQRLVAALADVRVAEVSGRPIGFAITREDELYQLYVARDARGSHVAAALVDDAEQRLSARGVSTAWLACAIGNGRAEAFYEKMGWRRTGPMMSELNTPDGPVRLRVWRYEKALSDHAPLAG